MRAGTHASAAAPTLCRYRCNGRRPATVSDALTGHWSAFTGAAKPPASGRRRPARPGILRSATRRVLTWAFATVTDACTQGTEKKMTDQATDDQVVSDP